VSLMADRMKVMAGSIRSDGHTLSHASWKSIPDSSFAFLVATSDRPSGYQGKSSVMPERYAIALA